MTPARALITEARNEYHASVLASVLTVDDGGVPANADRHSRLSLSIARGIANRLRSTAGQRRPGQTLGTAFEECNEQFLRQTFLRLDHLRPGPWQIVRVGGRNRDAITQYEQYAHLAAVQSAARSSHELAAALGLDYAIAPDILIVRELWDDEAINAPSSIVDASSALAAALRRAVGGRSLLHASISAKWTIRSDRSQNCRAEALNLVRNRKGHLPHVVVVTGEPLPSRLASIALGTGDIDCVYHFALYELIDAVRETEDEEALALLEIMTVGKRLKDISDLPLDLAV